MRLWAGVLLGSAALLAQSVSPPNPDWRHLGGSTVELMLASPATGPVDAVWFSADGSYLYARTGAGRVFETLDFETWNPSVNPPALPEQPAPSAVERRPDGSSVIVSLAAMPGRVYALGAHLYRSEDGGRSWTNLTAYKAESVIGGGQHAVAASPLDPEQIVVANDEGVWRSLDGGLSWSGLNQGLPGLPASRILATPRGVTGMRILAAGLGAVELTPGGGALWQLAEDPALARERQLIAAYSSALGGEITAIGAVGETAYAGASDGRIWVSTDSAKTWRPSPRTWTGGAVERFFVDAAEPRVALAALSGSGSHVLRTTNSGSFWDDLTANLGDVPAHGIAADRPAGAVYAATDKGVFFALADLENPGSPAVNWIPLSGRLPAVPATDVRLDPAGYQLYAALEGYGVYAAAAPHRRLALQLVNAADFSTRPAAPGSLLSVVGGRVSSARAGSLNFPVLAASDAESQIQVPFDASGTSLSLALETGRGSFRFPLPLQPVSPAIFVARDGTPMLLDADSGLMLDVHNTARSGARIQVLTTGLGKVRPDWPTGLPAPLENAPSVIANVRVWLDRAPLEATRAVLAPGYVGFYLVEFQLPALVNAGPAELYVTADRQESNRVRIFLEP